MKGQAGYPRLRLSARRSGAPAGEGKGLPGPDGGGMA